MSITQAYVHHFYVNLHSGLTEVREKTKIMQGDRNADRFVIHVQDCRENVNLDGVFVSALAKRRDGVTVPLIGTVEDGAAVIVLDEHCYMSPGEIRVTVTLSAGDVIRTVLSVLLDVGSKYTDIVADNGTVGNLDALLAEIATMRQVTAEAQAGIEKIDKALDFGAQHVGKLLVIGADGKLIPLAIGDGLEIVDGVMRVKATGEAVEDDVFYTADGKVFTTVDAAVLYVQKGEQ